MPLSVIFASAAIAIAFTVLWWGVASARTVGPRTVDGRQLTGRMQPVNLRDVRLQQSAGIRAGAILAACDRWARRATPAGRIRALERRITLAGRPHAWPIGRVLIAKLTLAALGFGFGFVAFADNRTGPILIAWTTMVVVGYFTPDLLLYSRATERQERIGKELPDTLDQMTIAVEAGLGFDAAMARAAQTGTGPLATELRQTLQHIQFGTSRNQALRQLADRIDSPDVRHFALAVVQAEGYGIPIADVLRTQAAEQRLKRRQRAEEHAMKIPVKIVLPLVLCILPTLFIVILGPAAIQISQAFFGD